MHEESFHSKNFSLKVWKKMGPFMRPYAGQLVAVFGLMIFMALIDVSFPLFLSYAVDNFVAARSTSGMVPFAMLYVAVILAQGLAVVGMGRKAMGIEMGLGRDLKRATFLHLQRLCLSYYNQNAVGWIMARVMSDTNRICLTVAWALTDLFWSGFYVIFVFVSMLRLHWQLALLVMLVVPVVAILVGIFQGRFLAAHRHMRAANSRITGAFNEGITGAKTSKTLVIEQRNISDFQGQTRDMYRSALHAARLNALFVPLITFFSSMAVSLVLVQGGAMVGGQMMSLGTLAAFVTYAISMLEPIQHIAHVLSEFIATQANIERVDSLLSQPQGIEDRPEVIEKYGDAFFPKRENWEPITGHIVFENVWFKYPDGDEWVLEDFSLDIPAGTNVALVGETGAGKSTLVNLACRFYEPTRGRILLDGRDIKERSQLWLHSRLGYVLQNPHLFSGTVMENIRYGCLSASDDEVVAAAALVAADGAVAKLPQGYETQVGEGGDRLSTGEKQLISFARAVLANPPIFVLDEATSSIDTETEQLIQNAISHILQGRTSFLVAHRLSTIRRANLILVVNGGKIVEQGSHAQLMAQKSYYHSLYTAMSIDETKGVQI